MRQTAVGLGSRSNAPGCTARRETAVFAVLQEILPLGRRSTFPS